jgi:hypothetical protein
VTGGQTDRQQATGRQSEGRQDRGTGETIICQKTLIEFIGNLSLKSLDP